MKIRSQDDFFRNDREVGPDLSSHGGELARGKRKVRRPFRKNQAHHLVMKSSVSKGNSSMLGPKLRLKIAELIEKYGKQFSIRLHSVQNVGNHIHLLVSAPRKSCLQDFMRVTSGAIARLVTRAGKVKPFARKFWDALIFSRVVQGARDFRQMLNYFFKNFLEAEGQPFAREKDEAKEARRCKTKRRANKGFS